MLTYEEFEAYCEEHGVMPYNKQPVKQGVKYQYNKYVRKQAKKDKWEECREEAFERNPDGEEFFGSLTEKQFAFFWNLSYPFNQLDPCHVISRSECSKDELYNNPDNIVIAPRYFHSLIDSYKNPFSKEHETITKDQRDQLWIHIIGEERWLQLQELK